MKIKKFLIEYWPFILIAVIATGILWLFIAMDNRARGETKQYCGEYVSKGYDEPTSGYKTHTDPVYYIIIRLSNGYNIRVNVTVPVYYNAVPGSRFCFSLDQRDLDQYGNGNKHLIP
jgi:hypothetical protein